MRQCRQGRDVLLPLRSGRGERRPLRRRERRRRFGRGQRVIAIAEGSPCARRRSRSCSGSRGSDAPAGPCTGGASHFGLQPCHDGSSRRRHCSRRGLSAQSCRSDRCRICGGCDWSGEARQPWGFRALAPQLPGRCRGAHRHRCFSWRWGKYTRLAGGRAALQHRGRGGRHPGCVVVFFVAHQEACSGDQRRGRRRPEHPSSTSDASASRQHGASAPASSAGLARSFGRAACRAAPASSAARRAAPRGAGG